MPQVIRVQARDVVLTVEIPLSFLVNLGKYLDKAVLEYDSSKPEEKALHDFLMEELYPFVAGTIEGLEKNGTGRNTI